MRPRFFRTPEALRAWLEKNHQTKQELLVGFHKVGSGKASITWPESIDEALSFGWIDGIRRSIDEHSYSIRFTPRKPTSIWSAVNIRRVAALESEGRMRPAGLVAFARRDEKKSAIYSYERQAAELSAEMLAAFQKDEKAWAHFCAQAPWYRRTVAHWLTNAKRAETQQRRLAQVIDCSRRGKRLDMLSPSGTRAKA